MAPWKWSYFTSSLWGSFQRKAASAENGYRPRVYTARRRTHLQIYTSCYLRSHRQLFLPEVATIMARFFRQNGRKGSENSRSRLIRCNPAGGYFVVIIYKPFVHQRVFNVRRRFVFLSQLCLIYCFMSFPRGRAMDWGKFEIIYLYDIYENVWELILYQTFKVYLPKCNFMVRDIIYVLKNRFNCSSEKCPRFLCLWMLIVNNSKNLI